MRQLSLLGNEIPDKAHDTIVNVASVPQRSPFRYPGGKTWLVPRVRRWLTSLAELPALFVEPFAGGGIISLTVAFERLADHIIMVELDPQVAAVWHTIIQGDAEWLARQIVEFDLTPATLAAALEKQPETLQEIAFQTILKNRTNRGGILAPGAGRVKLGENGKGIHSRWYPQTISRRIRSIATIRDRLTFIEGDGMSVMRSHADEASAAYFIDPPYTASTKRAGSRLYRYAELDHAELFQIAATLSGDLLMTYDYAPELLALAAYHGFDTEQVAMKSTHHAELTELLIGRDLDWSR